MKNPLDKLKRKKAEEKESDEKETDSKTESSSNASRSKERRKAFNEKPTQFGNSDDNTNDIKFKHLIETELNVIQKKAKALFLDIEDGFEDKSGVNYWKVSVNEFLSYVNQRSKIIIEQLIGECDDLLFVAPITCPILNPPPYTNALLAAPQ